MAAMATWHGTAGDGGELSALIAACNANCRVQTNPDEGCGLNCTAHRMLVEQRVLDGLLWARRCRELLLAEEMGYGSLVRKKFRAWRPAEETPEWAKSRAS